MNYRAQDNWYVLSKMFAVAPDGFINFRLIPPSAVSGSVALVWESLLTFWLSRSDCPHSFARSLYRFGMAMTKFIDGKPPHLYQVDAVEGKHSRGDISLFTTMFIIVNVHQ